MSSKLKDFMWMLLLNIVGGVIVGVIVPLLNKGAYAMEFSRLGTLDVILFIPGMIISIFVIRYYWKQRESLSHWWFRAVYVVISIAFGWLIYYFGFQLGWWISLIIIIILSLMVIDLFFLSESSIENVKCIKKLTWILSIVHLLASLIAIYTHFFDNNLDTKSTHNNSIKTNEVLDFDTIQIRATKIHQIEFEKIDSIVSPVEKRKSTHNIQSEKLVNFIPPGRPESILRGMEKYIYVGRVVDGVWSDVEFNIAQIDDVFNKNIFPDKITYSEGEYFHLFEQMDTRSKNDYVSYPLVLKVISDEIILEDRGLSKKCWLKVEIAN